MDRNIELALQHLENIKADPSSNLNSARVSLAIEVLQRIPQRKPLTDEQIKTAWPNTHFNFSEGVEDVLIFARAIEAAHGITKE